MAAGRRGKRLDKRTSKSRWHQDANHRSAVARLDQARKVTRGKQSRHPASDFLRSLAGAADRMDACDHIAILHRFAEINHRFDHAVILGEGKAVARRHVQPFSSSLLDRTGNNAGMALG